MVFSIKWEWSLIQADTWVKYHSGWRGGGGGGGEGVYTYHNYCSAVSKTNLFFYVRFLIATEMEFESLLKRIQKKLDRKQKWVL